MKAVDRIDQFLKKKGLSHNAFDASIGKTGGYINKQIRRGSSIGADELHKIVLTYPELNVEWVITGEGEMLREAEKVKTIDEMIDEKIESKLQDKGWTIEDLKLMYQMKDFIKEQLKEAKEVARKQAKRNG